MGAVELMEKLFYHRGMLPDACFWGPIKAAGWFQTHRGDLDSDWWRESTVPASSAVATHTGGAAGAPLMWPLSWFLVV